MKFFLEIIALAIFVSIVQANPAKSLSLKRVAREAAEITDSPYIAQIRLADGSLICSGAILNFLYILTTASCVNGYDPRDLTIVVGTSNLEDGTSYSLEKIIMHEEFVAEGEARSHDIAMLKLASYLKYNKSVRQVLIPEIWEEEDVEEGSRAVLSGWGVSSTLRRINQIIYSVSHCSKTYSEIGIAISDIHICGINDVIEEDISNNGAPLVQGSKLIGLKSWSTSGYPDVYTRVDLYPEWIEENNLE